MDINTTYWFIYFTCIKLLVWLITNMNKITILSPIYHNKLTKMMTKFYFICISNACLVPVQYQAVLNVNKINPFFTVKSQAYSIYEKKMALIIHICHGVK